jgi:predicted nucleic acid-binding protein
VRRLCVGTTYLIALFDRSDALFESAVGLGRELASDRIGFVTSHLVIAEFLAHYSRARAELRVGAGNYVRELLGRSDVDVVPLTEELIEYGLNVFLARPNNWPDQNKRHSLTDCVSMIVCRDLEIIEVLTADAAFEHGAPVSSSRTSDGG